MWNGDHKFLFKNLILKDFRIRYRNMSLGILWSVLNPLVMMGVLTVLFTVIFPNRMPHYPVFVLCGLVTFNLFAGGWLSGTSSLTDNAGLIKRIPVPLEIIPIASVVSNSIHIGMQVGLLLLLTLGSGLPPNIFWLWIPILFSLEIIFISGIALLFAGMNVYVRDVRYVAESVNTVMFWVVPVFYQLSYVPVSWRGVYLWNPISDVVVALRNVLIDGQSPSSEVLFKLATGSIVTFAVGYTSFSQLKKNLYAYL